jgi:hypothetical protein
MKSALIAGGRFRRHRRHDGNGGATIVVTSKNNKNGAVCAQGAPVPTAASSSALPTPAPDAAAKEQLAN